MVTLLLQSAVLEQDNQFGGQDFQLILPRKLKTVQNVAKISLEVQNPSSLPDLPWQKVSTDLFEWK